MYSILLITENIKSELQKRMDSLTLRWKGSDDTSVYIEQKPKVYAFTYDDLSNNLPIHTPSVLVQVMGLDDKGTASFIVHVCVCNPAKQDKEITEPVDGMNNVYQYRDGENIDSAGVRSELYKACLMLGEQVYLALGRMSNSKHPISNLMLDTPNPYLDNFPYCECTISFDVECSQTNTKINSDLWNML